MVEEQKNNSKVEFTKEELEAINKDIGDAKQSLSSKSQEDEKAKLKAELKKELEEEALKKAEQEEKDKKIAELESKLKETETKTADTLTNLQKKLDDSIASKQVTNQQNPFKGDPKELENLLKDPQKVAEIDEASREAFSIAMRSRTL